MYHQESILHKWPVTQTTSMRSFLCLYLNKCEETTDHWILFHVCNDHLVSHACGGNSGLCFNSFTHISERGVLSLVWDFICTKRLFQCQQVLLHNSHCCYITSSRETAWPIHLHEINFPFVRNPLPQILCSNSYPLYNIWVETLATDITCENASCEFADLIYRKCHNHNVTSLVTFMCMNPFVCNALQYHTNTNKDAPHCVCVCVGVGVK